MATTGTHRPHGRLRDRPAAVDWTLVGDAEGDLFGRGMANRLGRIRYGALCIVRGIGILRLAASSVGCHRCHGDVDAFAHRRVVRRLLIVEHSRIPDRHSLGFHRGNPFDYFAGRRHNSHVEDERLDVAGTPRPSGSFVASPSRACPHGVR